MSLPRWSLLMPLVTMAACAGPAERVATRSDPIRDGTPDSTKRFPQVFQFRQATGDGVATCTATLVTPRWMALANHCITGSSKSPPGPVGDEERLYKEATFDNAVKPPGGLKTKHSYAKSGAIKVQLVRKIWELSGDDAALDVALVRLDEPMLAVPPIHPAGVNGTPTCRYDGAFSATMVGYGDNAIISPDAAERRWSFTSGYTFDGRDAGAAVYWNDWFASLYNGPLPGDSGGPLFRDFDDPIRRRVCGGAARRWGWAPSLDGSEWPRPLRWRLHRRTPCLVRGPSDADRFDGSCRVRSRTVSRVGVSTSSGAGPRCGRALCRRL